MKHLNICTRENTIRIDLNGDAMSLMLDEVQPPTGNRPLEWSNTLLDGESVTFQEAEEAVAELGEGWRLPTREELQSILDLSRHDPAIDTGLFPDTKSCAYWTSTPCAWNTSARWVVYFGYGSVGGSHHNYDACVRAVRAGQ